MNAIEFPEQTVVIAEDQPEYNRLPAHRDLADPTGRTTFCWKLSWKERFMALLTGKVWHQVLTFGHSLQPQLLSVEKPDYIRVA